MKLELRPVRPGYVEPDFGGRDLEPLDPRLEERLRRPMVVGAAIIGVLVVGLGLWASLTPLASGVSAQGEVAVESNLKTVRHKEGGTVRQIMVKEGQMVRSGQPMLLLDQTEPKAMVDVLQNQADTLLAQSARADAEGAGAQTITFPAELTSRLGDARVAGLVRDQQALFFTKLQLFQSQVQVLEQRIDQTQNQIAGDQAQMTSNTEQARLTDEEMGGYKELYAKGYAPKSLILRYQRSMADFTGKGGSLRADIARLKQQQGETRMQMVSLQNQRASQAADDRRDAQTKLADVLPRLAAAKQTLDQTTVRAPSEGYVFNLTQYTPGSAVGAGETLMQVVPSKEPLIIDAAVKPQDIASIHEGMDARVRIASLNPRWHGPMDGKVIMVAPDKSAPTGTPQSASKPGGASSVDPNAMMSFYKIKVQIDPKALTKLRPNEHVTPGMPATVMLVSGKRTLMGFLISPITDTFQHAFHEE